MRQRHTHGSAGATHCGSAGDPINSVLRRENLFAEQCGYSNSSCSAQLIVANLLQIQQQLFIHILHQQYLRLALYRPPATILSKMRWSPRFMLTICRAGMEASTIMM